MLQKRRLIKLRKKMGNILDKKIRKIIIALTLCGLISGIFYISRPANAGDDKNENGHSFSPLDDPNVPNEFDVRGIHGTPRGTELRQPNALQLKALTSLAGSLGIAVSGLRIEYNGLTATPRSISRDGGYLTAPSNNTPEKIVRDFIHARRELFRFDESDLNNLKLASRAVTPEGTTVMLFQQKVGDLTVYNGNILVNVSKSGQIINVGGDNFPRLRTDNSFAITPAQAITNAAAGLGVSGFSAASLGTTQVPATFGDLPTEYTTADKFSGGGVFTDDITVRKTVFPVGDTARLAYRFVLTTPQFYGMMWLHIIDAQTGVTLRRQSLTAFFGDSGGGVGVGRKATFRPDIQNLVESNNNAGTAQGKVFDTLPTALSGYRGFGRSTRTGTNPSNYIYTQPIYAANTATVQTAGRGFKYNLMNGRNESALPFGTGSPTPLTFTHAQLPGILSQVTRGLPDAANPSAASPFGWFYLPTDTNGAEITTANGNRIATRALGYALAAEALARNDASNSPNGDGTQPFAADLTPLGSNVTLPDGRVLSSVFQSKYTEGNNVLTSDDRANDNEGTQGVKGYSANRNFISSIFNYTANYEYAGVNATGGTGMATTIPATANPDVFAGTTTLFYFNNVVHDYMYGIGFTEQFWNFQMDNFGKGGLGGDHIITQVQDGSGVNNANMGTGDDGSSPRMQMYLFTEGGFRRSDGSFDFDVVAHEQWHGISNRSAAKGTSDTCLGITLVGESGGMGEGWSDYIAASMTDDDAAGEFVTGEYDVAIRRLPVNNYRWSYNSLNGTTLARRDQAAPDANPGAVAFEVHDVGEVWSAMIWDMRELLIMKNQGGVFFDGNRRLGSGTPFYIGNRLVNSVDMQHPINYRASFNTTNGITPTINGAEHAVRPGLVAQEIQTLGNRQGPLASAVSTGAQLADKLVLRGLQTGPCNPTMVQMRDSILASDSEITGGENRAVIWRAFASHGVGMLAASTGGANDPTGGGQSAPMIVEDFSVPAAVTTCENSGPLAAPTFTLSNTTANTVQISVNNLAGTANYIIARSSSPNGPFATIATVSSASPTFQDNDGGQGLVLNQTYYYQVHAARSANCIGTANTGNITVTLGAALSPAPVFFGVNQVDDPLQTNRLTLSWNAAISGNPTANIVYDIYRVTAITPSNGTVRASFTPSPANRIAQGLTGLSFSNNSLTLGQIYYYIVQARDTNNGKIDTNDTGNTVTKFNAPSSTSNAGFPFAIENYSTTSANNRFSPPLIDSTEPNDGLLAWQRIPSAEFIVGKNLAPEATSAVMYAPDADGGGGGNPSDFSTVIGPFTNLQTASFLEFDQRFVTEAAFDGGVIEVALGSPTFVANPYPNNTTTFDLGDYIVENNYTGALNGTLAGPVILSTLQGRFAFEGSKSRHRTQIALGSFAPGGIRNPSSLPVYIRFRMTSDASTAAGADSGWYIDNLVINSYAAPSTSAGVSVSGRVLTANGEGIRGVKMTVTDSRGNIRTATTSSFGNYNFSDLSAGETYALTANSKRYRINESSRIVMPQENVSDLDFIAEE